MASKETNDGDDITTSTSPPPRNEDVESNSSPNEQGHFDWIADEVTGEGAINVNNPLLQLLPYGHQDYHIYRAAAGQQFPSTQNIGVHDHMFPRRIPLQLAGQVRPVARGRGRGTAQAPNNPTGPSQWRYPAPVSPVFRPYFTTNPYLVAWPVQHTTKAQTDSSISESIQAARSPTPPVLKAPFPPKSQASASPLAKEFRPFHMVQGPVIPVGRLQASNAPVRPSSNRFTNQDLPVRSSSNRSANQTLPVQPSRTPQSQTDLSALHALAQETMDVPIDHINQDFPKPPQPSGRECFLCNRDLSFTPEADGPISRPRIPPSVAILPCGHYFHARCLEILTPPEKSTDPPCILCDLDENAS